MGGGREKARLLARRLYADIHEHPFEYIQSPLSHVVLTLLFTANIGAIRSLASVITTIFIQDTSPATTHPAIDIQTAHLRVTIASTPSSSHTLLLT